MKIEFKMNLLEAAEKGLHDTVEYLVNEGASVNKKYSAGGTPLMNAAKAGHLKVVKFLANNGANLNDKNSLGMTPLMYAATRGHLEVVKYLVNNGANVNDKGDYADLWMAVYKRHTEVAAFLRSKGGIQGLQ